MSLRGNLEEINIGGIIQTLSMERVEGTMRVRMVEGGDLRERYFALGGAGEITLIIPGQQVRIGEFLVRAGKVTSDQVQECLDLAQEDDRRLSDVLRDEGYIEEGDVDEVLRNNFREGFFELCLAREGTFEFFFEVEPRKILGADAVYSQVSMNTSGLIMDALRQIDEWQVIRESIQTNHAIFVRHLNYMSGLEDLPEEARECAKLIDGRRTVDDIVTELNISNFELYEMMSQMIEKDMIRSLKADEAIELALEAEYFEDQEQAIKHYEYALFLDPSNTKMRKRLYDLLLELNRYDAALKQALALGWDALEEEDVSEALNYFDQGADIESRHPEVLEGLYRCYLIIGKRDRAEDYLAAAYEMGELLVREQKREAKFHEALDIAKDLLQQRPDTVSYTLLVAEIYESLGEPEHAIDYYREVVRLLESGTADEDEEEEILEIYQRLLTLVTDEQQKDSIRSKIREHVQKREWRERRSRLLRGMFNLIMGGALIVLAFFAIQEAPARTIINKARDLSDGADSSLLERVIGMYKEVKRRYPVSYPVWSGEIDTRINALQKRADELREKELALVAGGDVEQIKKQTKRLQAELEKAGATIEDLETKLAKAQTRIETLEAAETEAEVAEALKEEIADLRSELKKEQARRDELAKEREELLATIEKLKTGTEIAEETGEEETEETEEGNGEAIVPVGWPPEGQELPEPDKVR